MPGQIEPIERMVSELSRLPGIGHKTAARLAYHIVGMPLEDVHDSLLRRVRQFFLR